MAMKIILVQLFLSCICVDYVASTNIPPILQGQSTIVVPEDTTIGTVIGQLSATDADSNIITMSTYNDFTSSLVNLSYTQNSSGLITANITLAKDLDRDYDAKSRQLTFKASDGVNEVSRVVTLIVTDINDEKPVFQNLPFMTQVKENVQNGTSVYFVTADDPDSGGGGTITYTLEASAQSPDEEYRTKFVLQRSVSGGADIYLNGQLDFEKLTFYEYTLIAKDGGGLNSTAQFFVTIVDVQDSPPYFTGLPYIATVDENTNAGTEVFRVTALDQDRGIPDRVNYTISNDECGGLFTINSSTGTISMANISDRDSGIVQQKNGVCVLTALATELPDYHPQEGNISSTQTVTVTIKDKNDNSPTFNSDSYAASITENMQPGIPITFEAPVMMSVTDIDQGDNSEYNLTILDYSESFETVPSHVRSSTSVRLRVTNSSILDYEERHNITIRIEAKETLTNERKNSTATIILSIEDANDNDPKFDQDGTYNATVPENSPTSTPVKQINASDKDSGKYGTITYSIQGETSGFSINSTTGLVSVAISTLDREIKDTYTLSVEAADGGGRRQTAFLRVIITDTNDNAPTFIRDDYAVFVDENKPDFSRKVQVEATDNDKGENANISYSIESASGLGDNFTINSITGQVNLVGMLDYEKLPQDLNGTVILVIQAKDNGSSPKNSSVQIKITVQDENDNEPSFATTVYNTRILENATQGFGVVNISASDGDGSSPNNEVFFLIKSGGSDKFTVDSKSGAIVCRGNLDREDTSDYNLTVVAIDRGTPSLTASASVLINVVNVNDEIPAFDMSSVSATVIENQPNNSILYNFSATDKDENADLQYSIIWNETFGYDDLQNKLDDEVIKSLFSLDDSTGAIRLSGVLDRETIEQVVFHIHVVDLAAESNTPQTATGMLTLTIADVNDNSPTFNNNTMYMASIRENMQPGIPVAFHIPNSMTINDPDKDKNGTFSVTVLDYPDSFEPVPTHVRSKASILIQVRNSSILDYEERKNITLKVVAMEIDTEKKLNSTATVFISIRDTNDESPQFDRPNYTVNIEENSAQNTSVILMTATDADSVPNGMGTYSIHGGENIFVINSSTGLVSVGRPVLDREKKATYFLTVEAEDKGGRKQSVPLTVNLTDINDETPRFRRADYQGIISENADSFSRILQVEATDSDQKGTLSSEIRYSIYSTSPGLESNFTINNTTGVIYPNGQLDYETLLPELNGTVYLVIEAKDLGTPSLSSNVSVMIQIQDKNDNKPVFRNDTYHGRILENATTGTFVVLVSAEDTDGEAPNNELLYLIDTGGSDNFRVDGKTGNVTVQRGAKFDRETADLYNVTLVTIDRGTPQWESSASLLVKIDDVNDEKPTFVPETVIAVKFENLTVGSEVEIFNATDLDLDSNLCYSILWNRSVALDEKDQRVNISEVMEWFSITSSNGNVSVNSSMDRETAERMSLIIYVIDKNGVEKTPQSATGTLSIILMDVNDNKPQFKDGNNISISVPESNPPNTKLITIVATDADKGQTVSFSTDSNNFSITHDGILMLAKQLDREQSDNQTFTVLATDSGIPPQTATATVMVIVLDANDNDPKFNSTKYTFNITESAINGTLVAKVYASDKDIGPNADITYTLSDLVGPFRINKTSGEVFLNRELDREKKAEYSFKITAKDNPVSGSSRTAEVDVIFNILDENDNSPIFDQPAYNAKVSETADINSTVTITPPVKATDKDYGENQTVKYSSNSSLFWIDTDKGVVYVREELRGKAANYTFIIFARDQGPGNRTGNTTLTIEVLDENINVPKFVNLIPFPEIPECAKLGTSVYQFSATDADKNKNNNGKVEFRYDNATGTNDYTFFNLSKTSGVVTVGKHLDGDVKTEFKIRVIAYDLGIPPLSVATSMMTIRLKDINDNPPTFNKSRSITFETVEEKNGTEVGRVKADDIDQDSIICYNITGAVSHISIETDSLRNCILSVKQPLDRENVSSLSLTVIATDCSPFNISAMCDNSSYTNFEPAKMEVTISVIDIDDNKPVFTKNVIDTGIRRTAEFGKTILRLEEFVTDRDTAVYSVHKYYQLAPIRGDTDLLKTFDPSMNKDPLRLTENGTVILNMKFRTDTFGAFRTNILVNDSAGNDTAVLKVYVIGDFQVLKITFLRSPQEVRRIKDKVLSLLENATGLEFVINDDIKYHTKKDGTPEKYQSDMFIHAVDPKTAKILDAKYVRSITDKHPTLTKDLIDKFNVIGVNEASEETAAGSGESQKKEYILIAVVALLGFVLFLLIMTFYNSIIRYRRKLRAATIDIHAPATKPAMNGFHQSSVVSENPIFNKDIGNDYQYDNISSQSDNSLDQNEVNSQVDSVNSADEQEVTIDLYGDDGNNHKMRYSPGVFLDEALRHHEMVQAEKSMGDKDISDHDSRSTESNTNHEKSKYILPLNDDAGFNLDELESTEI